MLFASIYGAYLPTIHQLHHAQRVTDYSVLGFVFLFSVILWGLIIWAAVKLFWSKANMNDLENRLQRLEEQQRHLSRSDRDIDQ